METYFKSFHACFCTADKTSKIKTPAYYWVHTVSYKGRLLWCKGGIVHVQGSFPDKLKEGGVWEAAVFHDGVFPTMLPLKVSIGMRVEMDVGEGSLLVLIRCVRGL